MTDWSVRNVRDLTWTENRMGVYCDLLQGGDGAAEELAINLNVARAWTGDGALPLRAAPGALSRPPRRVAGRQRIRRSTSAGSSHFRSGRDSPATISSTFGTSETVPFHEEFLPG